MEKCSKCGNISVNDDGLCVVCDEAALAVNPYAVSDTVAEITGDAPDAPSESYSKVFVGSKYYSFFPNGGDIPKSWNWTAFFFGAFWFIYRKMYLYAVLYLVLGFVLASVQELMGISEVMINVTSIVLGVAAGIWANRLYKMHIDKKIAETLSYAKGNDIIPALKAKGGTNIGALLGTMALLFVVLMLAGI
ncbi:Protein of uncharacterised function (DUF2628) [Leminorella richardii]|uniref:Protein of uncharacterized function (DUF2628) n=1 Tax=Leminorella richardii TaxID=158841 RepID=A0A2X4URM3_9GAMM|nr:DUF2628 domain-containing protein [Leminorella richardii]SQI35680.1 Protein of uncharacterised function (DUF2628) [Leminorella richardii]